MINYNDSHAFYAFLQITAVCSSNYCHQYIRIQNTNTKYNPTNIHTQEFQNFYEKYVWQNLMHKVQIFYIEISLSFNTISINFLKYPQLLQDAIF